MSQFPSKALFILFLLVIVSSSLFCGPGNPVEEIVVSISGNPDIVSGRVNKLPVEIIIPDNYHAYIDHADEGSYSILLTIALESIPGITLQEVISPEGVREGMDMVLRGTGEFILKIGVGDQYKTDDTLDLTLKINAQLCNDLSEVCFPPHTVYRTLKISIGDEDTSSIPGGNPFDYSQNNLEEEEINLNEISWTHTIDEGKERARRTGKKLFVFVTAPTWCGPCQWMEAETLPDPDFIRFINTNFVPVLVLDAVDGERNPDLGVFSIEGFPSYLITTSDERVLYQDAGSVGPETLISELLPFADFPIADDTEEDSNSVGYGEPEQPDTVIGVDAVFRWGDEDLYMFKDGKYLRYELDNDRVDDKYPRDVEEYWEGMDFDIIDAALDWGNNKVYFFSGSRYIRFDLEKDTTDPGYPKEINNKTWPGLGFETIDAAVNAGDGKAFFFSGNEYVRYDIRNDRADPGYPKPINDTNWPTIGFTKIDAAANHQDKYIYFFYGDLWTRFLYDYKMTIFEEPVNIVDYWPGVEF